jgi:rSAM/selenodomain-associated transferase 1
MKRHVVVFAKAPAMGRVKTRLAREVGPVAALRFHRGTTERLVRDLGADKRWIVWLAVTPGPPFRGLPGRRVDQGRGDLGERMRRPMRRLPPGPVVIVGSDIPGITRRHVADAFRALAESALVFGPAADGGYWLVGARRRPSVPDLFRGVRWSTEHALADTLSPVKKRFSVALLDELEDVDDAASLRRASR